MEEKDGQKQFGKIRETARNYSVNTPVKKYALAGRARLPERMIKDFWERIDALPPDDLPLSENEKKQLQSDEGYGSWDEWKQRNGGS